MKKTWKKNVVLVVSVILLITMGLTLGGCSSSTNESPKNDSAGNDSSAAGSTVTDSSKSDSPKSDVKIKIVMDNNSTDKYTELFKRIGDKLGIQIELAVAPGNYEQFLQTQLQSSEKPDLFKLNGQYLTSFVKDGMTTDLNTYFNDSWKTALGADDWNKLTKGPFDQCRRESNNPIKQTDDPSAPLWAIPFDTGCQSFGINRGVIKGTPALSSKVDELVKNGVIPCMPWEVGMDGQVAAYTYSEFEGLLRGLQEVIKAGNLSGAAQNLKYAFQGNDAFKLMAYTAGGSFLNDNYDSATLTDEAVVNVAYFIKKGINEGYIDSMEDGGEGWNNWVSGMYLVDANTGTWEYGTYIENGMDVPMMPIPVPDGADRSKWVSGQTGSCMILRKDSPNTEMAAKVMCEFISRTSETYQLENAMNIPLYDDSWNDYINKNDANNGGFYPYDANCKKVFNAIISGAHGQVQETYYTVGRTWWSTFMTNYTNMFCLDPKLVTKQDVANWLKEQQPGIQALLAEGK